MSIQLADAVNAMLYAGESDLPKEYGNSLVGVSTYAQIRSYDGDATRMQVGGRASYFDSAGGVFVRTGSAADNDGTVLTDALGRSWERVIEDGRVNPIWFGAANNGTTDDYAKLVAARDAAISGGYELSLKGSYAISSTLDLTNVITYCAGKVTIFPLMDTGVAVQWFAASTLLKEGAIQYGGPLIVEWPTQDWTKERVSFLFQNQYSGEFYIGSRKSTRACVWRGDEKGCAYNRVQIYVMHQNLVSHWLETASATGWCNANEFIGGRYYGAGSVTGTLYEAQAGHIYVQNNPYQPNGNRFVNPSLEWVGAGFKLARLAGLRNTIIPRYCELDSGDTTWITDTGTENLIDCEATPYVVGYDPTIAGSANRVDVSTAIRPTVYGPQRYSDLGGVGTQEYRNQSTTRPTLRAQNIGTGVALAARNASSGANPGFAVEGPTGGAGVLIPAAGIWTVFNGTKKIHFSQAAAPTTGDWTRGDIVYFTNPSAGGFVGAVCVASGTPGTWKSFGAISA